MEDPNSSDQSSDNNLMGQTPDDQVQSQPVIDDFSMTPDQPTETQIQPTEIVIPPIEEQQPETSVSPMFDSANAPSVSQNVISDILPPTVPAEPVAVVATPEVVNDQSAAQVVQAAPVIGFGAVVAAPTETAAPQMSELNNVPPVEVKKPKKFGKKMIIATIILLLALIIGGSVSAYQFIYQSPKKVVFDAISGVLTSDAYQVTSVTKTKITEKETSIYSSYFGMFSIQEVKVNTTFVNTPSQIIDLEITFEFSDESYSVNTKGMYDENGNLYYQVNNVLSSIKKAFGDQVITDEIEDQISSLEGKWVKFSVDDMKKLSSEAADAYQCVFDTYKTLNKDKALQKELATQYEKYPFFIIDEQNIQSKDGKLGYNVSIDTIVFVNYVKSYDNLESSKQFTKCSESVDGFSTKTDYTGMEESLEPIKNVTTTLWIDQWSHTLKSVDVGFQDDESAYYTIDISSVTEVVVDNNLKIEVPDQPMTYSEWETKINTIIKTFSESFSG